MSRSIVDCDDFNRVELVFFVVFIVVVYMVQNGVYVRVKVFDFIEICIDILCDCFFDLVCWEDIDVVVRQQEWEVCVVSCKCQRQFVVIDFVYFGDC